MSRATKTKKKTVVCIAINPPKRSKSDAMNVNPIFVPIAIGVMNIKPIMRFVSAIDAMPFIVAIAMKWINATIVEKSYVHLAVRY